MIRWIRYNREAFASIYIRESKEKTVLCWQVYVKCSWVSYRLQLCEREKKNTMKITTNNNYRHILHFNELEPSEQDELKDNYDTIEESSFFRYRGHIYDLCEFMRNNDNTPFCNKWDGYHNDSFFSALLVKYSSCNDSVKVGLAIS